MQVDSAAALEAHRQALTGHCYRMLGSPTDADDAVQEAMLRAWKSLEGFDGRASLRTWLYRIATNVCLDMLGSRTRRERPIDLEGPWLDDTPITQRPASAFVEPIPDARVVPSDADPSERIALRQSVRLAFVSALQHLPPKQRAALLLTEVLDMSAAEAAEALEISLASLNSALQRARATLASRRIERDALSVSLSDAQSTLIERYVEAFERYDMSALTALLHEDATMSMPPYTLWLRGHASICGWMLGHGKDCRGSRLVRTEACGAPAFGQYRKDPEGAGFSPWSLIVLELEGEQIVATEHFLDTATLFPLFGLPPSLT